MRMISLKNSLNINWSELFLRHHWGSARGFQHGISEKIPTTDKSRRQDFMSVLPSFLNLEKKLLYIYMATTQMSSMTITKKKKSIYRNKISYNVTKGRICNKRVQNDGTSRSVLISIILLLSALICRITESSFKQSDKSG